ncbi:branched-chain amino acid ABC transporter permease [bacterium]|nr:MAG: branched-chain amino acid ABC transporter permease [bacterium]
MLEYSILAGILFGLYFGLVALGLNLIFGVMKIVNLAHGDFLMLGAYGAYIVFTDFHVNPLVTLLAEIVIFVIIGFPLYYLLVPRLQASRDPEMLSLILFFGLSQVIEALATLGFGSSERSIPGTVLGSAPISIFQQTFPVAWVVSGSVSLLAVGAIYVYLYRTRLGQLTRAVMAQREEALSTGIDVQRISAIAFGIGIAGAAVAGVLSPFMMGSITPAMGVSVTITSFAVIVMGSLGNPLGTVAGGIIYGIALMFMQTYFSSWANLLPYLLLIAILLVKPTGLFGRRVRNA